MIHSCVWPLRASILQTLGQSVAVLGWVGCTNKLCLIVAYLNLVQGNEKASRWYAFITLELPTHSCNMRPGITPGGTQGPLHQHKVWHCSEDFSAIPNSSQSTVGFDMEICATLQRYSSPDHRCPTAKPILQDDVTGNIMTTRSPRHSHVHCEPALICVENVTPMADLPILEFSREYQPKLHSAGLWAQVLPEDAGSLYWQFGSLPVNTPFHWAAAPGRFCLFPD